MARLQKTLTDYIVIALTPGLIMSLIGSLNFFLIQVFYRGDYVGRLQFITACFTLAAVLIARISIDDGREHAVVYMLPLAASALFAMGRLTGVPIWLSLSLIGLILWCADKLVWDCTVIDEREDASSEGLLQTVGIDANTDGPRAADDSPAHPATAAPRRRPEGRTLWARFLARRQRPHPPGVWVVYFSLAALPLFGIGQRFLAASDLDARRYAFKLLCVYTASGLGLLMTASFLGLRRYLRQRKQEMPIEMAGIWLTAGSAMIVALLLACCLLPRPNAEYSVSQLAPFQIGSSARQQASPSGWGNEPANDLPKTSPVVPRVKDSDPSRADRHIDQAGGDRPDARRRSPTDDSPSENPGDRRADAAADAAQHSSRTPRDGPSSNPPHGDPAQPSSGNEQLENQATDVAERRGAPAGDERDGKSRNDESQLGNRQDGSHDTGQTQAAKQAAKQTAKQTAAPDPRGAAESSPRGQPAASEPGSQPGGREPRRTGDDGKDERGRRDDARPADASNDPGGARDDKKSGSTAEAKVEKPPPDQASAKSAAEDNPFTSEVGRDEIPRTNASQRADPWGLLKRTMNLVPFALKWLYNLIFAAIVAFLLWRNRAHVLEALRDFWRTIHGFWAYLFGFPPASTVSAGPATPIAPPRRFLDFPDPFATGDARRWPLPDLVAYSFQALEAWAREQGCQRDPDQTPHEFAQTLGAQQATISRQARGLADLYCCAAYSNNRLPADCARRLQELWQAMLARAEAGG